MNKEEYLEKIELLKKWSDSYYNGESLVDDEVFDSVLKEVKNYEKNTNITSGIINSVGSPVFRNKINHKVKMYSMLDLFTQDEVISFLDNLSVEPELFINPKFDGVALSIVYRDGNYITGVTRGNGIVGEAIPDVNMIINNIPTKLNSNRTIEVRGEVLICNTDLKRINKENELQSKSTYSNRRNAASGLIRHNDRAYVKECNLFFMPYDLGDNDIKYEKYSDLYNDLDNLGFNTKYNLPKELYPNVIDSKSGYSGIYSYYGNITNIRDDVDIQLDGVVIRVNDLNLCEHLGHTNKYPLFMFAYKFLATPYTTKLIDVVYNVGRTGVVTPVAILDPIDMNGVIVKQCTLHNFNFIKDLNIKKNSDVVIIRSGDVIPKIIGCKNNGNTVDIMPPTNCPSCGNTLIYDNTFYKCTNPNCKGSMIRKFINFVSREGLNIEGLGDELIDSLVKKNLIYDFKSIFSLTKEDLLSIDLVGDIKANNILNAIEKSKDVELNKFIYSLGIPGVGSATANIIANTLGDKWHKTNKEDYIKIDTIGELVSNNIISYIENNYKQIEDLIKILNIKHTKYTGKLSNKTIMITGTLDLPRHQYEELIKREGGILTKTINNNLNYLIVGEDPSSIKLEKAKNIKSIIILTLQDFKKLIE